MILSLLGRTGLVPIPAWISHVHVKVKTGHLQTWKVKVDLIQEGESDCSAYRLETMGKYIFCLRPVISRGVRGCHLWHQSPDGGGPVYHEKLWEIVRDYRQSFADGLVDIRPSSSAAVR